MSNSHVDDLKDHIANGSAVAIIGAGVSIGATNNHQCASWTGLLTHGAEYCAERITTLHEGWKDIILAEINSGDMDNLLSAAEKITQKLGGRGNGEYRRWLQESVGNLAPSNADVISALQELGVILATTNYDGLITQVSGLQPITWMDGAKVERVLRGDSKSVIHLHGYWDEPESVILGIRSYEDILDAKHAQTILRLLRTAKTLIFIGCGEGLADPNFNALLKWSGEVLSGSLYPHYRLCLEGEVQELQKMHPPEQRLFAVPYGETHQDLPPFLRNLKSPGKTSESKSKEKEKDRSQSARLPSFAFCFGRDAEIEEIVAHLLTDNPRPLPILGQPGIGKSTLTLAALHDSRVESHFGARRYFIRCDAAKARNDVAADIAMALGLKIEPNIEPMVLNELAQKPTALALDNLETPWEADTLEIEAFLGLLTEIPGLALIGSLRGNERPFGIGWRSPIQPSKLTREAARRIFTEIAGAHFEKDPLLNDLIDAVDSLPLAISLLAHEAEGEPNLNGLWKRWNEERTEILKRADGKDRLTNIELSYEISLAGKRMTDEGKRLLSLMGLLPNGVAWQDIDQIMPKAGNRAATTLRKAGLAFDEEERLKLFTTLREYIRKTYPPQPEDLEKLSKYYFDLGSQFGKVVGTGSGSEKMARISPETNNIEMLLIKILESENPALATDGIYEWAQFVGFSGLGSTQVIEMAAEAAKTINDENKEAWARLGLGEIALARSDYDRARQLFNQAKPIFERVGDLIPQANCIQGLGVIALDLSEYDLALQLCNQALPIYKKGGNLTGEANCIFRLGEIALDRLNNDLARQHFDEALPIFKKSGSLLGEANCIYRLDEIALDRADYDLARKYFDQSLPLYEKVGDLNGEAISIWNLGNIAVQKKEYSIARGHYEASLVLLEKVGGKHNQGECLMSLGDLALIENDPTLSRSYFNKALQLFIYSQNLEFIGRTRHRLARVASIISERQEHIQAAREAWEKINRPDLIEELKAEFPE